MHLFENRAPNLLIIVGDKSISPAARPAARYRLEWQPHRHQNDCAGGIGRRESSRFRRIQKILALLSIGLRTGLRLCLRPLTCSAERGPISRVTISYAIGASAS